MVHPEHRCRDLGGVVAGVAPALGHHPGDSCCCRLVVAVPRAGASRLSL